VLVFSRRPGESVRLGDEIKITVLSVSPGQIRVGIDAPAHVSVHREEVYEEIVSANRESAVAGPETLRLIRAAAEEIRR